MPNAPGVRPLSDPQAPVRTLRCSHALVNGLTTLLKLAHFISKSTPLYGRTPQLAGTGSRIPRGTRSNLSKTSRWFHHSLWAPIKVGQHVRSMTLVVGSFVWPPPLSVVYLPFITKEIKKMGLGPTIRWDTRTTKIGMTKMTHFLSFTIRDGPHLYFSSMRVSRLGDLCGWVPLHAPHGIGYPARKV